MGDPCASDGTCDGAGACDAVTPEGTECETICVRPHGPPKTLHGECDAAGTCQRTHGPGNGNGNACE